MSGAHAYDFDNGPALRAIAMPADTNPNGDIFGGWLLAQMDLAGGTVAVRRSHGRVATVGIEAMTFHKPVFVGDVARAIAETVEGRGRPGAVYELGGPEIHSFRDCMEIMLATIGRKRLLLPLPFGVASAMGSVLQYLPGRVLTPDQVRQLRVDNVVSEAAIADRRTFAGFGIEPTTLEAVLPSYLTQYRVRGEYGKQAV